MNEKGRKTLYLVAGLYLIYLAGSLLYGLVKGESGNQAVMVGCGILFLAAGGYLVVDFIKFKKNEFTNQENKEEEEES